MSKKRQPRKIAFFLKALISVLRTTNLWFVWKGGCIFEGPIPENNLPSEISFLYFRFKIIISMVLHGLIGAISPETHCCKGF
jgi:hypothetical protein